MVTGYEADFYRQFGELTKNSHQIVNQLKQNNDMLKLVAGNLVNLRKQLEENNVKENLDKIVNRLEQIADGGNIN